MSDKDYLRPPEEIDMAAAERAIRIQSTAALVATVLVFVAAYHLLPRLVDLPAGLAERLAFGALSWAAVAVVLLVAIGMVSTARRFSPADIGGQAAGPPSEALAVKSAFLQNTLEQTVLAAGFFLALPAVAGGAWLALLPAAAVLFVVGRGLFYLGYRRGVKGRAFGMALTILPSAIGYLVVAWLLVVGA